MTKDIIILLNFYLKLACDSWLSNSINLEWTVQNQYKFVFMLRQIKLYQLCLYFKVNYDQYIKNKNLMDGNYQQDIPAYCLIYCEEHCMEQTLSYEFSASLIFSILAILVSAYNIFMHLHNFNNPFFQSKIIVILIMAPFYCLTSMGSFVFPSLQIYLTLTRDSYEALLLFTFFYLMFSYLAYDRDKNQMQDKKVYIIMISYEKEVHHFFPFNYCQKPYQLTHWKKAKYFTYRCKKYVLQFLIVKLATTLLMYIIYPNEQQYQHQQGYVPAEHSTYLLVSSIVSWIIAISASYSLYYLVLFYHALSKPLAPYSALLKFLTIKITIFFTFWQRIMIYSFKDQLLACFDQNAPQFHQAQIISCLQNTLICFEMLLMAIAGGMAYNYQNYISPYSSNKGNIIQVINDTASSFKKDFRLIKPKKFGFNPQDSNNEIELSQIKYARRQSVVCQIKTKKSISESMIDDYL